VRQTGSVHAPSRSTGLGYLLAATAAALWALNGSLARFLLDDGVSALRLAQLRSLLSWVLLVAVVAAARPNLLRVRRADVPQLAFLGIAGLAAVHATYFLAIGRLEIGAALTIQYLGPLLILVWLRVVHGRHLRRGLWAAAALSLTGSFLVVRAYDVRSLDALGVAAAVAAAVAFAVYLVASERAGRRHHPITTLAWGFGFASLFWAIVQPPWWFPFDRFGSLGNVLLGLGVAVIGTLLPFLCMVAAVRHIPSPRAAVVATLEPVLAAVIAYFVHDQALAPAQIAGGLVVVAAVVWVQLQRVSVAAESAPERRSDVEETPVALEA
jgi:drug/metabolite transporter (DMT)-like permease